MNVLASLILVPYVFCMVLRPSKFNFREMRKVSVQEKYRHVNEDVSQAFELFWFGTHERENEFIAYLYSYTICVARIFI